MHSYYALYFFLLLVIPLVCHAEELQDAEKDAKLISTFQIVRFPNDACVGSNTRNGTCYTSAECSDKDGTSSGSCADGFGVCCTFLLTTCDQTTSENLTYWTQPATAITSGTCGLTVCPVTDDICRLRLDFTNFVITGPSGMTTSQAARVHGQARGDLADTAGVLSGANFATNCLLDVFLASGASPSSNPPKVCGTLTGTHMYVEANPDSCNFLQFNLAAEATTTITDAVTRGLTSLVSSRTWDMTVTQLECTNVNMPPVGCTQYFYGTPTVKVSSYNYFATAGVTALHLGTQHQRICIRRERGMCIGCFYGDAASFNVSGDPAIAVNFSYPGGCGGYFTPDCKDQSTTAIWGLCGLAAAAGTDKGTLYGWDMVIIPGAFGNSGAIAGTPTASQTAAIIQQTLVISTTYPVPWPPQICGNSNGIGIGSDTLIKAGDFSDRNGQGTPLTVCTRHTPFTIEFMTDDQEGLGSTAGDAEFTNTKNNGFSLFHTQLACT